MAYPEKLLGEDEEVVEHLHPHWVTLVPATVWFVVICAAAGAGVAFAPSGGTGQLVAVVAVLGAALVLLCWLSLAPWIRWRTTHYVLTTHRVLIRRGVLHHVGRDIALQRISDVGFAQSLWDRIVGAGTLTIESASEYGQETLTDVPHSDRQQQLLNRLIEQDADRRTRAAYESALRHRAPGGRPPAPWSYPDGASYQPDRPSEPFPPQR